MINKKSERAESGDGAERKHRMGVVTPEIESLEVR